MTSRFLYILAGPTASGKTTASIAIAKNIGAEIVCLDSMSIYKRMDIGTAKVSLEERNIVPHHLLNICEPWEEYSAQKFLDRCVSTIEDIFLREKKVLLVVGTPLYLKMLLCGLFKGPKADKKLRNQLEQRSNNDLHFELLQVDQEAGQKISVNDTKRIVRALEVFYLTGQPISKLQKEETIPLINYPYCICCLNWNRDILYRRVEQRVDKMIADGLIEETKNLLQLPYPLSITASKAIGYKDVLDVFSGKLENNKLVDTIKQNTRRYAKRQMTWWRSFAVEWVHLQDENISLAEIENKIMQIFESK